MKQLCPFELEPYVLFNEDCVLTSKRFVDSSIDLVYVDPPFCSGRSYELNGCSFDDKWRTTEEYIDWIKPRLVEFKRILKPTGSIYIHCNWHISHYIKVLADSIFGQRNFLNEIVWKRQSAHNDARQGSKHFGRIHDVVLVYTASQKYVWNQEYLPYDHDYLKQAQNPADNLPHIQTLESHNRIQENQRHPLYHENAGA
jgi:adenine specific DNA methylase Mod